jgi:hypothetical protein
MPWKSNPLLLFRTREPVTRNPEPALALGAPLDAIRGVQPRELVFAVQYVSGVHGHS